MGKINVALQGENLQSKALWALRRSWLLLRLKLFFGYLFRSPQQRELGREKLGYLDALIQKVRGLTQDAQALKTPQDFLNSKLLDQDDRTVETLLNQNRVKSKEETSTAGIVLRALGVRELKPLLPTVESHEVRARTETAKSTQTISRKTPPRKIVFWCGTQSAIMDHQLIEDLLPTLQKKLPDTSIQIKKLCEVDEDPNADVLYFYVKLTGARVDVMWEDAAQSYLSISKGNCVWILSAECPAMEDEILRADLPSSQIRDTQGSPMPLRICFPVKLENFKLAHRNMEQTFEQILGAVRAKGWDDLITNEAKHQMRV